MTHPHSASTLTGSRLRCIICGSVDADEGALIGRLLGTTGGTRAFDVTVACDDDTRSMVGAASSADIAVILIDARHGVVTRTRQHAYLASLLGIGTVVAAITKLDHVDNASEVFDEVAGEYRAFAAGMDVHDVVAIPMPAGRGDTISGPGASSPWYRGPSLLDHLEQVELEGESPSAPFRMPLDGADRTERGVSAFSGTVVSGTVRTGDRVRVVPGSRESTVVRLVAHDGERVEVAAGQATTITLADELDIGRGDVLASAAAPPAVADQFEADVIWVGEEAMTPGRHYRFELATLAVGATLGQPRHKVSLTSLEHVAAKTLEPDDIGVCTLTLDRPVAFDPYVENRAMGGFVLVDRLSGETVAAGLLRFALRRSQNIHWQAVAVDKAGRAAMNDHRPAVVWFTGLSGAGKSAIADIVEQHLHARGARTYLLDGDNVRHGLNRDLGFTDADRIENIRRVAEVAALMADAGLIVLVSFISPFRDERRLARSKVGDGEFCEVFVDTPLAVAEARDVKGLYRKARAGALANFTGIDSPYEPPEHPEVHIDTTAMDAEAAAATVIARLEEMGVIPREHHRPEPGPSA